MAKSSQFISLSKPVLALTGFMGVGKTFWGRIIATELNCPFYDLDDWIHSHTQYSAAKWITTEGESRFREIESIELRNMLLYATAKSNLNVVSLGGGTLLSEENLLLLKEVAIIIWIKRKKRSYRLREIKQRPLLQTQEYDQLYRERIIAYAESDITISFLEGETDEERWQKINNGLSYLGLL